MLPVGFIQGRLSPKPANRIQAFPKDSWREEFSRAKEIGFECLELIYDDLYLEQNPLATDAGRRELVELSQKNSVRIGSICSDYFMQQPLDQNLQHAVELLHISKSVHCELVEFPFVDSSSLMRQKEKSSLVDAIFTLSEEAKKLSLRIAIESDLPPVEFRDYLKKFPMNVGANLDLGNSAALGYDVLAECRAYGERIFNVHIKDRILAGTTVPLLTGHTDFNRAFKALAEAKYRGDLILQTAPDPDFLGIAKKYFTMTKEWSKQL